MADARISGWTWWGVRLCVAGVGALLALPATALSAEPSARPVTFAKDVAPILQEKCQSCHRPDSIAPMSLLTYEEVRPWARSIRNRVAARQMPPWDIDKTVGIQHFENDRSLSDEQIETVVRWADAGAPLGDPKDLPRQREWPNENVWAYAQQFGEPDVIIKSPAWTMPANAQDAWYRPVVETGLTEPRWVRAIEIRPGTVKGRKITHHAVARLRQDDGYDDRDARTTRGNDPNSPGLFMEWAVGKQGEVMRPNSGKLLLPGSKIVWDIHYHAIGEQITDSVEMALYFYPKGQEPKYRQVLGQFDAITGGRQSLDIPPNSVSVHQAFHVMKQAGRIPFCTSMGTTITTCSPALMSAGSVSPARPQGQAVSGGLMRLSVGVEPLGDIQEELLRGLTSSAL